MHKLLLSYSLGVMCVREWQPQSSLCQFMPAISLEQAGGKGINEPQRGIESGQDLNIDFSIIIFNEILDRFPWKFHIF